MLGAAPAVSTYVLPALLQRFAAAYPRIEVAVRTGHSEDVLQMLLREEVQLAMVRTMRHPDIESIPLYEEALVLVVPPGHPFAKRSTVGIADVASERLIFFDRTSSYYELTQSFFLSLGVTPREVMELDNIESAKKMVERRLGIALLPRTAVSRELQGKSLWLVKVKDAHARSRCRDENGTEPWACCECDCTQRLETKLAGDGRPFLEVLRQVACPAPETA